MFRVNRSRVKVAICIHRKLVDVDCDIVYPADDVTGLFVEDGQVAHPVAGVDTIAVACQGKWHDVRPFINELPFHFKQAVKTFTNNPEDSGTLMSYVMFNPDYIHAMMELGEKDTLARMDEINLWANQ